MKRRTLRLVEGVTNIELFYDLIFVYCISVLTSLCSHVKGFITPGTWLVFTFSYLAILQVWFYTTLLMNRFGESSAADNIHLFINMFLLYYMASGVHENWADTRTTFNLAWALILLNQAVAWGFREVVFTNLDDDDRHMIRHTVATLAVQSVMSFTAAFADFDTSVFLSGTTLLVGAMVWRWSSAYRAKSARFAHVSERCSLLTIIAFGEMVVALSAYMFNTSSLLFPLFAFALVVGLFLIYIFEHDNMLDQEAKTDGMTYMTFTSWLIIVTGNLTVALEYMPNAAIDFLPKSIFLAMCLVLYLLTSFTIARYNKPEFKVSGKYVAGRIGACAFIVVVGVVSGFHPLITLLADTAAVYFALWHEWLLYHRRIHLAVFGRALGHEHEMAHEHEEHEQKISPAQETPRQPEGGKSVMPHAHKEPLQRIASESNAASKGNSPHEPENTEHVFAARDASPQTHSVSGTAENT